MVINSKIHFYILDNYSNVEMNCNLKFWNTSYSNIWQNMTSHGKIIEISENIAVSKPILKIHSPTKECSFKLGC